MNENLVTLAGHDDVASDRLEQDISTTTTTTAKTRLPTRARARPFRCTLSSREEDTARPRDYLIAVRPLELVSVCVCVCVSHQHGTYVPTTWSSNHTGTARRLEQVAVSTQPYRYIDRPG